MDLLFHEYTKDETLLYTILRYLIFPVVLLVIGGVAANILYPRWQDRYIRRKYLNERKFEIGENILSLMNNYMTMWRRLINISIYEKETITSLNRSRSDKKKAILRAKLEDVSSRKMEIVKSRSNSRDSLMDAICRIKIYIDSDNQIVLDDFTRWDAAQSTKTLDELPDVAEWQSWEERIRLTISRALLR